VTWTELHALAEGSGITAPLIRSARALMLDDHPTALIAVYNAAVTGRGVMTPEAETEAKSMTHVLACIRHAIKADSELAVIWKGHE